MVYQHFRGRQSWWQSSTGMKWLVIAGGAGGVYYVAHIETVPYSGRWHAVLVSPATEKALGWSTFQQVHPAGTFYCRQAWVTHGTTSEEALAAHPGLHKHIHSTQDAFSASSMQVPALRIGLRMLPAQCPQSWTPCMHTGIDLQN